MKIVTATDETVFTSLFTINSSCDFWFIICMIFLWLVLNSVGLYSTLISWLQKCPFLQIYRDSILEITSSSNTISLVVFLIPPTLCCVRACKWWWTSQWEELREGSRWRSSMNRWLTSHPWRRRYQRKNWWACWNVPCVLIISNLRYRYIKFVLLSLDPLSSRYGNVQKVMWSVGVAKSGESWKCALSAASSSLETFREIEVWKSCQERCSHSKQSRRRSQLEKGNKFHPRRMSTRFVYRRMTIWGFLTGGWIRWMWYIIISI